MSNIIEIRPGSAGGRRLSAREGAAAIAEARELLADTIDSLKHDEAAANSCHLAAIEKIKRRLGRAYDAGGEICSQALDAMSLVELARIAIVAGFDAFKGGEHLTQSLSIAEALGCALDRLDLPPSNSDA